MSQLPPKKTYNQMAAERAAKIQKLREKKELEQRTGELTVALNEGRRCRYDNDDKDDEIGREKWVALLQLSVYKSQEFVNSIDNEIPILRHMESIKKGEVPVAKKPEGASGCGPVQESPRQPVKPLVITREMLRVSFDVIKLHLLVLFCVKLCHIVLSCISIILHQFVKLCHIVLSCIILHRFVKLCHIVLSCIILCHIVLSRVILC